jgi:hypothetical protein
MKIDEFLYFAPNTRFVDVDLASPKVVDQFKERIQEYYLVPARLLAKQYLFGACVLLASALDAIGRFESPPKMGVGERYISWTRKYVPSLGSDALAKQFYYDFRCGVIHEGRAKKGCVFTTETGRTITVEHGLMAVNTMLLWDEVKLALDTFCTRTLADPELLQTFQNKLREDFEVEMREQ